MRLEHCNGKIAIFSRGPFGNNTDTEDCNMMKASLGAAGYQTDCLTVDVCNSVEVCKQRHRYPLKQFAVKCSRAIILLRMESASVTLSPIVHPPPIGSDTPSRRLSSHQRWHAPCRHGTHSPAKAPFHFFISLHHHVSHIHRDDKVWPPWHCAREQGTISASLI